MRGPLGPFSLHSEFLKQMKLAENTNQRIRCIIRIWELHLSQETRHRKVNLLSGC
jgi:hypothetical protein